MCPLLPLLCPRIFLLFFCWALKILNRRHWNSSTIHQKWFFPVDLVSHTAIAKNTVVLKKSQRWRWHCWLLWHGLSLAETCSSTGSCSTDQGEAEEFTCDNLQELFFEHWQWAVTSRSSQVAWMGSAANLAVKLHPQTCLEHRRCWWDHSDSVSQQQHPHAKLFQNTSFQGVPWKD